MLRARGAALALTAIVMLGSFAACGGSRELTDKEVAARDKAAAVQNRVARQKAAAEAQRRLALKFVAGLAARKRPQAPAVRALESASMSVDALCVIEPRATGRDERRAQRLREQSRRIALYKLNLSCTDRSRP